MAYKLNSYSSLICTVCWNNDFDISCSNCDGIIRNPCVNIISDGRIKPFAEILTITMNCMTNYHAQIEDIKSKYIEYTKRVIQ